MRATASGAGARFRLGTALLGLLLLAAVSLTACGGAQATGQAAAPSPAQPAGPTSPVEGQVVKLDTEGLTKVRGFVLRTDAGVEIPFTVGPLENAVEFPPSHLAEHMATGAAVRAWFRPEGTTLVVYRVEDAAGS